MGSGSGRAMVRQHAAKPLAGIQPVDPWPKATGSERAKPSLAATFAMIEQGKVNLQAAKEAYVSRFGWRVTCNAPGAYWLWQRDFAAEDEARHRHWQEAGPGPLGWPSEPQPYRQITADLDMAVAMTRSVLDEDEASEEGNEDRGASLDG